MSVTFVSLSELYGVVSSACFVVVEEGCPMRASHQEPWAEKSAPAALRKHGASAVGRLREKARLGAAGHCGGRKFSCLRTLPARVACLASCSFLLHWPPVLTAQAGFDHRGLVGQLRG